MNLVYIYSIPRETSTRVDSLVNQNSGEKSGKTKMGNCADTISALYSPKLGALANGLSDKAWTEKGEIVRDSEGNPLTLQDKLEKKWNLEKGYLTARPWKTSDSRVADKMTYYQTKSWRLNDGATVLNLDNMEDELGYYMMLDSKYVANSEKEWKAHKWPFAKWYIALHNEADELRATRSRTKAKAKAALVDGDFPYNYQVKFVNILGLAAVQTILTPDGVYNLLDSYIENSGNEVNNQINNFMELYNLLQTATGKIEIEARFLLKKCLDHRIMYEKQGTYNWPRPEGLIRIGETYREAVDYLLDPKRATLVQELEDELKIKGI